MTAPNTTYESLNDAFIGLAKEVFTNPQYVSSPRGQETKELLGVSLVITSPYERYIYHPSRGFSTRYAIAEWLWYMRGSNALSEIRHYSKFWDKISDDGMTLNSAYGYRIFGHHPNVSINQWSRAINELRSDPDTRRAIILVLIPDDLKRQTKDLPCTAYIQFFIRDNRLHLSVSMRSNDLVLGFSNDVFAFTLFQELMLVEMQKYFPELAMGYYYHYAGSMHIYQRHYEMIAEVVSAPDDRLQIATLPHLKDISQLTQLETYEAQLRNNLELEVPISITDSFCKMCAEYLKNG